MTDLADAVALAEDRSFAVDEWLKNLTEEVGAPVFDVPREKQQQRRERMSVYHEAIETGRISLADCSPVIGRGLGFDGKPRLLNKGIKRRLREVKRAEAEERNAETPGFRRAAARREAAAALARLESKVARR